MVKKVILGGTFHKLHKGHKKMLDTAFDLGDVSIGLVSDDFLAKWKPELDAPYEERKKELGSYLSKYERWEIVEISDPYSEALKGDYDILVVSWDTKMRGEEINDMRRDNGEKALEIVVVPPVMAEDFIPISSTRIREGKIDEEGKRLSPVRLHVGTENSTIVEQVKKVFSVFLNIEVTSRSPEGLKAQPFGEETVKQAEVRADCPNGYDYGVGVERGIFFDHDNYFLIDYAVIEDSTSYQTMGHGPGLMVPTSWIKRLQNGETLSGLIDENYFKSEKGDVFSDDRSRLYQFIEQALITAMIARINIPQYLLD